MTAYERYLRSPAWRRRRKAFARNHPRVCPCGETRRLDLHHKTYERLGHERDSDLMWLCRPCHVLVEQLVDEARLDRACTDFFSAERATPTPDWSPAIVVQRQSHAALVRAVEQARQAAKRAGDNHRQREIEAFSQARGLRY